MTRPALLLFVTCLAGCWSGEAPTRTATQAAPRVQVTAEALDRDGDGAADTWLRVEADGTLLQARDTDGDGKPDVEEAVLALQEPPPGFDVAKVERLD